MPDGRGAPPFPIHAPSAGDAPSRPSSLGATRELDGPWAWHFLTPGRAKPVGTGRRGGAVGAAAGPPVAREQDQARRADRADRAGDQRDEAGERRDQAGGRRDQAADERDHAAQQRDQAADERDEVDEQSEARVKAEVTTEAQHRSGLARREAAADRRCASQDRRAGASERSEAELDRDTALADRGASARERENASVDDLTGVYLRAPGLVELQREMARARRTDEPLVLAFVDVDRLKVVNDSRGHAAGDRMLLAVADTFRAHLRSYDLIIRYGGDEFLCAISGLNTADATKRLALVNAALAKAPDRGSVTVGVAELQADDSPEDLVARADAALYRHRQQQRRAPD